MAFVRNHTGGQNKTNQATFTFALSANTVIGNTLFVQIVSDNIGSGGPTVSSISKPTTETVSGSAETGTWARVDPGAAFDGGGAGASSVVGELWAITMSQAWLSTYTPTITLSAARTSKAAAVQEHSNISLVLRSAIAVNMSTVGTPSAAVTGPLTSDLVIAGSGWETAIVPTGDSDTTNGSWSTISTVATSGGLDGSNVLAAIQYKYVTGAGTQTYNPTGTSNDVGVIVAAIVPGSVQSASVTMAGTNTLDVTATDQIPSTVTMAGTNTLTVIPRDQLTRTRAAIANRNTKRVNIGLLGASLVEGYPCAPDKTIESFLAAKMRVKYPITGSPTGYGVAPMPSAVMASHTMFTITPGTGGDVGTSNSTNGWGANHQAWFTNGSLAVPPILVNTIIGGPWSSFDIDLLRVAGYSTTAGQYRIDGGSWVSFSLAPTGGSGIVNERLHVASSVTSTIEVSIATGNASSYVIVDDIVGYAGDETIGIQVHNFGHSGYKCSQWSVDANPTYGYRFAQALNDLDLLIISDLGVNDAQSLTSATFQTDLDTFLDHLFAVHSSVPIILVAAYDMTAGVSFVEPWQNYVTVLRNTASARHLPFIDLTQLMPATPNAIYGPDNLHSNTNGDAYAMMADIFLSAIAGEVPATVLMTGTNTLSATAVSGGTQSATVTMAGTNTLAAGSTQQIPAAVAMAGTNTLATGATDQIPSAVTMAGVSTLSVSGRQTISGAVTMAGTGTLAAGTATGWVASVTMAGSSTLSVSGRQNVISAVTLAGVNTLSVSGSQQIPSAITMAGSSTLATGSTIQVRASVTMAGSNTLAAGSQRSIPSAVAMAGANVLTVAGRQTISVSITMAGANTLAATATVQRVSAITMAGANTLSAPALDQVLAAVTLAGVNTLAASSLVQVRAAVTLAGVNTLTATGFQQIPSSVTMAGTNLLIAGGSQTAAATLTGTNTLTVTATVQEVAAVSMAGVNVLSVAGQQTISGTVTMVGVNTLSTGTALTRVASVTLAGINTLSSSALDQVLAAVAFAGVNSLSVAGRQSVPSSVLLAGVNTLSIDTAGSVSASVLMTGTSSLASGASVAAAAAVTFTGVNTLAAGTAHQIPVAVLLVGTNGLVVTGDQLVGATVMFLGENTLSGSGGGQELAVAVLAGTNTLTASPAAQVVASALMAGTNVLSTSGRQEIPTGLTMAGIGTLLAAAASELLSGAVVMAGVGTLTIEGGVGPPAGLPPDDRIYAVIAQLRLHVVRPAARSHSVPIRPRTMEVR